MKKTKIKHKELKNKLKKNEKNEKKNEKNVPPRISEPISKLVELEIAKWHFIEINQQLGPSGNFGQIRHNGKTIYSKHYENVESIDAATCTIFNAYHGVDFLLSEVIDVGF